MKRREKIEMNMKIEIVSFDASGTHGVYVYCNGKRIQSKSGGIFPTEHTEDEILELIGEKNFKQYEQGKNEFSLSKKQIFAATEDINFYTPIK